MTAAIEWVRFCIMVLGIWTAVCLIAVTFWCGFVSSRRWWRGRKEAKRIERHVVSRCVPMGEEKRHRLATANERAEQRSAQVEEFLRTITPVDGFLNPPPFRTWE